MSQDDFPTGYGELRQWLREQIDSCEGLIQLVGHGYGAEPPEVDPDYGRVSYTQLEFLYAHRHGQEDLDHSWSANSCHRDKPLDRLDLPREAVHRRPRRLPGRAAKAPAGLLSPASNGRITSATPRTTTPSCKTSSCACATSWASCGEQWEEWLAQDADFKARTTGRLDELAEAAQLTTEKIRAHLLRTTEETHRRELAEAEAATDWKERQRLREAADDGPCRPVVPHRGAWPPPLPRSRVAARPPASSSR